MKKIVSIPFFLFLITVFAFCSGISAQNNNCDFTVNANVQQVTCPGNGEITVTLSNTGGKPLSNFRYSLFSNGTTIGPQVSNVFNSLGAGVYEVIVDAFCGTEAVTQTLSEVTVTSSYVYPGAGLVQGNFVNNHLYGSVPSFSCASTGSIQLRIDNGVFPYIVEVQQNGAYYRTDTFYTNMYSGNDPQRYDYQKYYTINNLAPGDYVFRVSDGCGYSMPFITATVSSIPETFSASSFYIYREPAQISSNIVRFSLLQAMYSDNSFFYYVYSQMQGQQNWWEYQISVDGVYTSPGWKDISTNGVVQDTITTISNYCALYGKTLRVTVRDKVCQRTYSHNFTFNLPNAQTAYQYTTDSTITTPASYDSCGYTARRDVLYQHTSTYYQQFNGYRANQLSNSNADYYYTPPLSIALTNSTTGEVIAQSTSNGYNWKQNISLSEDLDGTPITVTVTDANGCVISNRNQTLDYQTRNYVNGGGRNNTTWQINNSYRNGDNCGQYPRGISIKRQNPSPDYLDSTIVRLVQSPENNKYNFTALYLRDSNHWRITKDNPINTANIYAGNDVANDLEISAVDLSSGIYQFQITTQCKTETINRTFTFPDFISVSTPPQYELVLDCGALNVIPVTGQIQISGVNTTTYFKVIGGPAGGYPFDGVTINNPIRLTLQGEYTFRMYSASNDGSECAIYDTVLTYTGATIQYDYLLAYVCSDADVTANVNVRGKEGKTPYTYTVSKDSAGISVILASDTIGDFTGVRAQLGNQIHVRIEDACGASFESVATVVNLESTRKAWFGNNSSKTLEICQGDIAYLDGLSLGDVNYSWTGPNGYTSVGQNASLLIPRNLADAGWYYLQVSNSFCPLVRDSIYLSILEAPSVTLLDNAAICPGETYTVNMTANGQGSINYVIGMETNSVVTQRTFSDRANGQVDTIITSPLSRLNIWVEQVSDNQCSYAIPEDTITINIKSTASSCLIEPLLAQVCFDSSAVLTAEASMNRPYVINWYADAAMTTFIKSDTINDNSALSQIALTQLTEDTTFYVTAQNADYCAYKIGVSDASINMNNGTTEIDCGESIRFYDSGGANANYGNNEAFIHTFVSTNGEPVNIRFDSFVTEDPNFDKMYIYDGGSINSPVLASELGGDLNSNLPGPFVSTGDSLTVLFASNFNNTDAGWSAMVGVSNNPITIAAQVLDTLNVTITTSDSLPIHYNGSTVLTANASGGHPDSYQYQWYYSTDNFNWIPSTVTTATYPVNNIIAPTYYMVTIRDNAPDACGGTASSRIFINVANINLSLKLRTPVDSICPGDFPVDLLVINSGIQAVTNVLTEVQLPTFVSMHGAKNVSVQFPSVPARDSVIWHFTFQAESVLRVNEVLLKAQIMSADQGDNDLSIEYGDWNWDGFPRQKDEDTITVHIKRNVMNSEILAISDTVCYGNTANLQASSLITAPQYYYWYSDSLGTNLLFRDTINVIGEPSVFTIPNLTQNEKRYITLSNENVCPFYVFNPQDELLIYMTDGLDTLTPNEIIHFYDSGGPFENYSSNENYTYTIATLAGDPVVITFNSFITDSVENDYLYLHDGNSTSAPLLAELRGNLNSQMPITYTANSGALTMSFQSGDSTNVGWEAIISSFQQLKRVDAIVKMYADPAEITVVSDTVCSGGNPVLQASSAIDYPQTFKWYSDDSLTNLVYEEVVDGQNNTMSSYNLANQTVDAVYYVTVGNDSLCNLTAIGMESTSLVPAMVEAKVSNPEVSITGNDTICLEGVTTLSPVSGGTWVSNNTSVATVDNAGNVLAVQAGTVNFTFTDSITGCSSTTNSIVVISVPTITVQNISICSGSPADLNTAVVRSTGTGLIFYSDANATIPVPNPQAVPNITSTTTFYVRTENIETGCISELESFNVTVNPLPTLSVQNIAICSGADADLRTAVIVSAGSIPNFYYDPQGNLPVFTTGIVSGITTATTFYVRAVDINTLCESPIQSFTVTVNPLPGITVHNMSICIGEPADLTTAINTTSGTTPIFYYDELESIEVPTPENVTGITASTTYYVRLTDNATACMADLKAFNVIVNPLPVVNMKDTSVCMGSVANLKTAVVSTSADTLIFYTDQQGNNPVSTPDSVTDITTATTYYVKGIYYNTMCESALIPFTIDVNPLPTLVLLNDNQPICEGFELQIQYELGGGATGATINGLPEGINYSVNGNILTINGIAQSSGNYNYEIVTTGQDRNCAPLNNTANITINGNPTAAFSYVVNPIDPLSVTFTDQSQTTSGTLNSWNWDFGDASSASIQNPVHNYGTEGYYDVTLRISTNLGCVDSVTRTIHTNAMIQVDFNANDNAQCLLGNTFEFTDNSTINGATTDTTYRWDFGDGSSSTERNPQHSYAQLGIYNVTLTVSSSGSTQSASKTVTVLPAPPLMLEDLIVCSGTDVDLTDAIFPVALTTPSFYADANQTIPIYFPYIINNITSDTTFYVKIAYGVTGCESNLDSFNITVNPAPTIATQNIFVCVGSGADLETAVTDYSQGSMLSFYRDANEIVPILNQHSVSVPTASTFYVKSSYDTGCESNLSSFTVVAEVLPTVTLENIDICIGQNADLSTAIISFHGDSVEFYSDIQGTISIPDTILNLQSTTTYYAKSIGEFCNSEVEPFIVNVHNLPDIVFSDVADICVGKNNQILAEPGNGTWENLTPSIASISPFGVVTGEEAGLAQFRYVVENSYGCTDSAEVSLNINPLPRIVILSEPEIQLCNGEEISLNIQTNGNLERWYSTDPAIVQVTLDGTVSALSVGTAELFSVVSSEVGCIDSASVTVNVVPLPDLNNIHNFVYCHGEAVSAYNFEGNMPEAVYKWERVWGEDFGLISTEGQDSIEAFTAINTGIYPLIALYEAWAEMPGASCKSEMKRFLIVVNPMPDIANISDKIYCNGTLVNEYTFTGNVPNADFVWYWNNGDKITDLPETGVNVLPAFTAINNSNVRVQSSFRVTADYNYANRTCNNGDTLTFNINILPTPQVDINNPSQVVCSGESLQEIAFTGTATNYKWQRVSGNVPGMPSSGSGNIFAQVLTNIGTSVISADYIVTPEFEYGGILCQGESKLFSIFVNPQPRINTFPEMVYCNNERVPAYSFGDVPGVIYTWERTGGNAVGLPENGNGMLPEFKTQNSDRIVKIAEYTVTAQYVSENVACTESESFTITVNPAITVDLPMENYVYCAQQHAPAIDFRSIFRDENHPQGTIYEWKYVSGSLNIGLSRTFGTDSVPQFTTVNTTNQPLSAVYSVTPILGDCIGEEKYFEITVIPGNALVSKLDMGVICSGNHFEYLAESRISNTTYSWQRIANASINNGNVNQGTGNYINEQLINYSDTAVRVTYEFTLTGGECAASISQVSVVVNPAMILDVDYMHDICRGAVKIDIPYLNRLQSTSEYQISFSDDALIKGFRNTSEYTPLPSGEFTVAVPQNVSAGVYIGTLHVRNGNCIKDYSFAIRVLEGVTITKQPESRSNLCDGTSNVNLSVEVMGDNATYQWYRNGVAIQGATTAEYQFPYEAVLDGAYFVMINNECGNKISSDTVYVRLNTVTIKQKWDDVIYILNENEVYVSYQWYKDGTPISKEAQSQYYSDPEGFNGSYYVKAYYADGTYDEACPLTISEKNSKEIVIYPNPAAKTQKVTLRIDTEKEENVASDIEIYDVQGRIVFNGKIENRTTELPVKLNTGGYMVKIVSNDGKVVVKKLIIK